MTRFNSAVLGCFAICWVAAASSKAQAPRNSAATRVLGSLKVLQLEETVYEGAARHWVVRLDKRPLETGTGGYRPAGALPTSWEPPVDFYWNFGDDTGWFSTGERPSITHTYREEGSYWLRVEARSDADTVRDTLRVEVRDQDLRNPTISAVEVDPASGLWELTSGVRGADVGDDLEVTWSVEGRVIQSGPRQRAWRTETVLQRGTRELTVAWRAKDGSTVEKTRRLTSRGSREVDDPPPADDDPLLEWDREVQAEGIQTRFDATLSEFLTGTVRAEIRPFAGLFLGSPGKDKPCRFHMMALDPKLLVGVQLMANLPGLVDEGKRFRYSGKILSLGAKRNAEDYLEGYASSGFNERVLGGVARSGLRGNSTTTGAINEKLGRLEGGDIVQFGPRERQLEDTTPSEVSPLGIGTFAPDESEHTYSATGGSVELFVVPESRIVGLIDVPLEGGNHWDRIACREGGEWSESRPAPGGGRVVRSGFCRRLKLKGKFALDLKAAPRDGIVNPDGCEPQFGIDRVLGPKDGEENVISRRPRSFVSFTSAFDPETLNEETFQLTYLDRTGRLQPVESRIHRDSRGAFLAPVKNLWGGVHYVVRVKTGEDGVRGLNGAVLDAEGAEPLRFGDEELDLSEDDWYAWDYTTRLDFEPSSTNEGNLSCHVYQNVRDAPLLAGILAVAVVYPDWKENPQVAREGQTLELPVRAFLEKRSEAGWEVLDRQDAVLVMPALAPPFDAYLSHLPKLNFTPEIGFPSVLRVTFQAKRPEGWVPVHWTACSAPVWSHRPKMTVEIVTVAGPRGVPVEDLRRVRDEVGRRDFPLVEVEARLGMPLGSAEEEDISSAPTGPGAADEDPEAQALTLLTARASEHFSDLLVLVTETDRILGESGATDDPLGAFTVVGPAYAVDGESRSLDARETAARIEHQMGHALGLDEVPIFYQLPFGDLPGRGRPIDWHDGFESAAYNRRERRWIFVSSRYGDWFHPVPLMHPRESGLYQSWLLRHEYLQMQEHIEDTGFLLP